MGGPPPRVRVEFDLTRPVVVVGLVWFLAWLVGSLGSMISQLMVALAVAYIFSPLVARLEGLVKSRALAVVLLVVPLIASLALVAFLVVPRLVEELITFASKLPGMLQVALSWLLQLLVVRFNVDLPQSVGEFMSRFGSTIQDSVPQVLVALKTAATGLYSGGAGVFKIASGLVIIPVFSVYFLYDFDRIVEYFRSLVPRRYLDVVVRHAVLVDRAVASFFRGQLTVCLVLGSLYALGFTIIGLRLALFIGLATGALAIVPYAGAMVGFGTALLTSVVWFESWWLVLGVVVVFVVVQTIDGLFITPRILGKSVDISPVLVIISLMAGGKLFGFVGVLVAVPTAASLRVLGASFVRWYKSTSFYLGGEPRTVDEPTQNARGADESTQNARGADESTQNARGADEPTQNARGADQPTDSAQEQGTSPEGRAVTRSGG